MSEKRQSAALNKKAENPNRKKVSTLKCFFFNFALVLPWQVKVRHIQEDCDRDREDCEDCDRDPTTNSTSA